MLLIRLKTFHSILNCRLGFKIFFVFNRPNTGKPIHPPQANHLFQVPPPPPSEPKQCHAPRTNTRGRKSKKSSTNFNQGSNSNNNDNNAAPHDQRRFPSTVVNFLDAQQEQIQTGMTFGQVSNCIDLRLANSSHLLAVVMYIFTLLTSICTCTNSIFLVPHESK